LRYALIPPPNKKARFALAQRPAGSKLFSQGLLLDIESLQADPTYIPDINDPDSEDNHSPTGIAALCNNEDLSDNDSEDSRYAIVVYLLAFRFSLPRRWHLSDGKGFIAGNIGLMSCEDDSSILSQDLAVYGWIQVCFVILN
jgi:hypothetical protein